MKFYYEFVGGKYNKCIFAREQVEQIGNGKYTEDLTEIRKRGGLVHREELDNQPEVDGYYSPMWDGFRYVMPDGRLEYSFYLSENQKAGKEQVAVIRYETAEVYDMLSR